MALLDIPAASNTRSTGCRTTSPAAALRVLGFPPLVLDLEAVQDTDDVLAVYRMRGRRGAIAKSNFSGLGYRERSIAPSANW